MRRRLLEAELNFYKKKEVGDIIYDKNNPIGIVAYKTSSLLGVMAIDRRFEVRGFPVNVSPISTVDANTIGNMQIDSLNTGDYRGLECSTNLKSQIKDEDCALNYCLGYGLGGHSWYMPTSTEISWIYTNRDAINESLNSLGKQNWQIRTSTGIKDIECILSCTKVTGGNNVAAIRLNEDGRILAHPYSMTKSKDLWSGGYYAYASVYPFFSIQI